MSVLRILQSRFPSTEGHGDKPRIFATKPASQWLVTPLLNFYYFYLFDFLFVLFSIFLLLLTSHIDIDYRADSRESSRATVAIEGFPPV